VIGRAFYVMEFVDGRVLWDQALPACPAERAAIYDEMNRVIAALHGSTWQPPACPTTASPATTSSARSAAGASSTRVGHRAHRGDGSPDRMAAGAHLPAGALDESQVSWCMATSGSTTCVPPHRAACAGGAGLGAVHARPPAGRLQLPLHGLAHPAGVFRGIGGLDLAGAGHSGRARLRAALLPSAPAWRRRRADGRLELLPGLQPVPHGRHHCRALPSASRTARPPARRPAPPARPHKARAAGCGTCSCPTANSAPA
jgi:hypothetical protein